MNYIAASHRTRQERSIHPAATSGASEKPRCLPFARCFWNVAVFNSFHRTVLPPTFLKVSARHCFADAARFRERGTVVEAASENPVQGLINVLGTVLGFNFVVIVGLFLWFLSGVFSLYALDNDTIIIAVKAAFDPFILPLLSTHMGLTFLSYGLEKAFGEGDPEDDGGFRL